MQKLKEFCKTENFDLLTSIPHDIIEELKSKSVKLLRKHKGNRRLMKRILHYYDMNDANHPLRPFRPDESKARFLLKKFGVVLTGARQGDILVGLSLGTSGAVIKIMKGQVYPEKGKLDHIRPYRELWNTLLVKLRGLDFFSDMSFSEIEEWLSLHEDSYHNDFIIGEEDTSVLLQVFQPGELVEKISEKQIEELVMGNPNRENGWWTGKEIENMIPKIAGKKGRKHTLALCRHSWKLSEDYSIAENFEGGISDIYGEIDDIRPYFVIKDIPMEFDKVKSKVKKPHEGGAWWRPKIQPRKNIGVQSLQTPSIPVLASKEDLQIVRKHMKGLSPAAYKSFIQKIIRYRPLKIRFPDRFVEVAYFYQREPGDQIESDKFLNALIMELILMPGSFVPDIKRFVSGQESAFKRIGVIVAEDAYGNPEDVATAYTAALLSQRVKSWKPGKELLEKCLTVALEALNTSRYWDWDWMEGAKLSPLSIEAGQGPLDRAAAILFEIRSFPSDIGFMRYIAENPEKIEDGYEIRPEVMDMQHCVDQHWAPNLAYFYRPSVVNELCGGSSNGSPFSNLFKELWQKVSSVNPRKIPFVEQEFLNDDFVGETRIAQSLYLIAKQNEPFQREIVPGEYDIDIDLPIGWLAALVGVLDVGGSPCALVTLSADDPYHLIAVRRPSREKGSPLTEEQKDRAEGKALELLRKGVSLNAARPPLDSLKRAKLFLNEGSYEIRLASGERKKWDEIAKETLTYPIVKSIPSSIEPYIRTLDGEQLFYLAFEWLLLFTGDGVVDNFEEKLREAVSNLDSTIVRRMLLYLSGFGTQIEMYKISRDGGGSLQSVTIDDVSTFQALLMLSAMCPGAFVPEPGRPGRFKVQSGPLLWHVRDIIRETEAAKDPIGGEWEEIEDSSGREMWPHQIGALDEMIENFEAGNQGSFLWLKVGLGKTLIVLQFIKYLIENNSLPPYVIYTLPNSAINSVLKEIQLFSLPITFLVPNRSLTSKQKQIWDERIQEGDVRLKLNSCVPDPYRVNIITTDAHLRKCRDELSRVASESFIIFDEVHKNLNTSQRSTTAKELASLSRIFAAFTGTPVIDTDTNKLSAWLSRIVPFEVNDRNYLVAANTMISRPINTGIEVIQEDVLAPMSSGREAEYRMLVPPALGGQNTNPDSQTWREAMRLCYEVCDEEMINKTLENLEEGVMLVAKDTRHQNKLFEMLIASGVEEDEIFVMSTGQSLLLTEKTVEEGGPDYSVVIVKISQPEGYTLTLLNTMISSVYPSNQASRTQMEGRINRIGQQSPTVTYIKVHTGILTLMLRRYKDAKSIEAALRAVAKHV